MLSPGLSEVASALLLLSIKLPSPHLPILQGLNIP